MEPSWARSAGEDGQGHRPREDRVDQRAIPSSPRPPGCRTQWTEWFPGIGVYVKLVY